MISSTRDSGAHRDGFTLVEIVVVVAIMGLVTAVIAAAFSVIVRTSPANEARADDSRSLLGLTNWLAQDAMSASARDDGASVGDNPTSCDPSTVPAGSEGLLELKWGEGGPGYVANYRYVPQSPTSGAIYRYTCVLNGPAQALRTTSEMENRPIGPLIAPVAVVKSPLLLPDGTIGWERVNFRVFIYQGGTPREILNLDASTANIPGVLPPVTPPPPPPTTTTSATSPNGPPTASPVSLTASTGVPATRFDLAPSYISDPEGGPLTLDFCENAADACANPWPGSWNVAATGLSGTIVEFSPPNTETGTSTFYYRVQDSVGQFNSGGWVPIEITIVPPASTTTTTAVPNQPPTAFAGNTNATKGLPVDVQITANDPEGGSLTVTVVSTPSPQWTAVASPGPGLGVTITPPDDASGSDHIVRYRVTDPGGLWAEADINIDVCTVGATVVAPSTVLVNSAGTLQSNVSITITTNGACVGLVAAFKPQALGPELWKAFNAGATVQIATTEYSWDYPGPPGPSFRNVDIDIRQSVAGATERSGVLRTERP